MPRRRRDIRDQTGGGSLRHGSSEASSIAQGRSTFERVQLARVIATCRRIRSLSNTERLRRYSQRFDPTWRDVQAG